MAESVAIRGGSGLLEGKDKRAGFGILLLMSERKGKGDRVVRSYVIAMADGDGVDDHGVEGMGIRSLDVERWRERCEREVREREREGEAGQQGRPERFVT